MLGHVRGAAFLKPPVCMTALYGYVFDLLLVKEVCNSSIGSVIVLYVSRVLEGPPNDVKQYPVSSSSRTELFLR